jgi:topoisomerase-4 subunit A
MAGDLFSALQPPEGGPMLTLADYAERAYLDYAISVVKGRALPDLCDGLKPVQRRILHAMNAMGLAEGAKPVKSARVVGDVLGRFHPHGDTAAYDALVRMAQPFTLRYPLIDGQGNFGSRDGDGAAAMRYTEARLTRHARLLLDEIDQGTVDFVPNYDGSAREPRLLPARLPMMLLNGASGIAVGLATEIPPHNLREVAAAAALVLREPDVDLDRVLSVLPGPDFPGGAQIISSPQELREIYAGGRGSLRVRARHTIEELARGQWQLVVTELPHGVSSQKVLEAIEELTNPKVKAGKRSVSAEQQQLRQTVLAVLDTVRDESGKDAPVRLVFEPRSSRVDPAELLATLLAHTGLESSVPVNLVCIGADGRPAQKGLLPVLREWTAFRLETVTRRSRHRLAAVDERIHVLEGRQLVLLNLDEVIRIIRESDEPKPALIDRFGLSDRQAEDILEIRLRQLARLEAIRIETELARLREDKRALEALLANPAAMRRQVVREIDDDARRYGDERRTLIEAARRASLERRVSEEPLTVFVSTKGWVRARAGHGHDAALVAFKAGDALDAAWEVSTTDALYAIGSNGRVYSVPLTQLPPTRGDGVPITSLVDVEAGTRIEHLFATRSTTGLCLATRQGVGLLCEAGDLAGRTRQGKAFLSLDEGDVALRPALRGAADDRMLCLSVQGRALVFDIDQLRVLRNGGRGSQLMTLEPDDALSAVTVFGADGVAVRGTARGGKVLTRGFSARELEGWRGQRGRKGKLLEPRLREASADAQRGPPATPAA